MPSSSVVSMKAALRRKLPENQRLSSIIATQTDIMSAELDLLGVMHLVAQKAQHLTGADGGVIEMREGDELVYRAVSGSASASLGARVPVMASLSGLSVRTEKVLQCDDTEDDPRVHREACRRIGVRSMVVVPLTHDRSAVGVLKVIATIPGAFDNGDVETLQLIATLLGAAIARAADYDAKLSLMRDREAALAAAEEQTQLLRSFFEAGSCCMSVLQREGVDLRHLAVNLQAANLYGTTIAEMVGKSALELGVPERVLLDFQPHLDEAERSLKPVHFEYLRESGGSRRSMAATICVIPGFAGRFAGMFEDITERVHLQQRLDLSDRMATVGRLAAGVAHEANNPLAFVVSNLVFLDEEIRPLTKDMDPESRAEVLQVLKETKDGAKRVQSIVRDLYLFSRSHEEVTKPVVLAEVLERTLPMATQELRFRAKLVREFGPTPMVVANEARLGQVLLNLVMNAAQAIPEGSPDLHRVTVRTGTLPDGRAMVEVEDTGEGIAPENLARIFDPFFTTKKIGQGMGLGLSICHNIVAAHAGELTVRSELGKGTCFRVALPAGIPAAPAPSPLT